MMTFSDMERRWLIIGGAGFRCRWWLAEWPSSSSLESAGEPLRRHSPYVSKGATGVPLRMAGEVGGGAGDLPMLLISEGGMDVGAAL